MLVSPDSFLAADSTRLDDETSEHDKRTTKKKHGSIQICSRYSGVFKTLVVVGVVNSSKVMCVFLFKRLGELQYGGLPDFLYNTIQYGSGLVF